MSVTLQKILAFEEGIRYKPYLCPANHWTIAVGWNLEEHGLPEWVCKEFFDRGKISHETAIKMLDYQIAECGLDAKVWYQRSKNGKLIDPPMMTEARRRACENMAFQLGLPGLMKFKKTRQFVQQGLWSDAAEECLDSKWARDDSPARAKRVARVFESGDDAFYEALF